MNRYTVRIEGGTPELSAVANVVANSKEEAAALVLSYLKLRDNVIEYDEAGGGRSYEPEVRSFLVSLQLDSISVDCVDLDGTYP